MLDYAEEIVVNSSCPQPGTSLLDDFFVHVAGSVSVAGYVGIARFSRFGSAKVTDTMSETASILTFQLNERILPSVSIAW